MNRTERLWSFRQLPSDAQGNRVLKEETGTGGVVSKRTWYVRDAAGQHLTTYEQSGGSGTPRAKEYLLYGSSRLGTAYADNVNGGAPVSGALYRRVVGQKQYEVADHLGNVRATVGDIKVSSDSTFAARVASYTEYFPFGMVASTATVAGGVGGRFGFNGQERVDELKGLGNHNTAEFWEYDTRAVQRFNMDPRPNMEMSPYAVFAGNPVMYSDAKGDTVIMEFNKSRHTLTVKDMDHYQEGLPDKVVSAKDYVLGGIRDKDGKLTHNQVLLIENVFSGGASTGGVVEKLYPSHRPIPNGDYSILEHPDRSLFRLDAKDKEPYNDTHDGSGRNKFRLHLGTFSTGCITCDKSIRDRSKEWSVLISIMQTTSTTMVPERITTGWQWLNPFRGEIVNYGTMRVIGVNRIPDSRKKEN